MTFRTIFPVLAALTVTGTLAAPAAAQRGQLEPGEMLARADSNGDGVVTRDEYAAARMARFDKMDRNHDGYISRDDFGRLIRRRPSIGQRLDTMLAQADANHDGRMSRDEQADAPMPLFDRADTNHDGRIDAAEMAAARERMDELRQSRR